jgi:hypothetical protein
MLSDFQNMHSVYQSGLDAEMLQRINAQDSAATARDGNNKSEFGYGFTYSNQTVHKNPSLGEVKNQEDELRARFEVHQAPTPWVHYVIAAVLVGGLCFLVYKGVFNAAREMTIDDVPDDELFEAFEPEVAQRELHRRFERANARRDLTKLIKNDTW